MAKARIASLPDLARELDGLRRAGKSVVRFEEMPRLTTVVIGADTGIALRQKILEGLTILINTHPNYLDNYIAISEETGRPVQKPYSGKLMLRVSPDVHAAVAAAADVHGKSINQWASEVLDKAADI